MRSLRGAASPLRSSKASSKAKLTKKQMANDPVNKLKERLVRGERLSEEELVQLELASVARWDALQAEEQAKPSAPVATPAHATSAPSKVRKGLFTPLSSAVPVATPGAPPTPQAQADPMEELRELRASAQRERATLEQKTAELRQLRDLRAAVSKDPQAALDLSSRRLKPPSGRGVFGAGAVACSSTTYQQHSASYGGYGSDSGVANLGGTPCAGSNYPCAGSSADHAAAAERAAAVAIAAVNNMQQQLRTVLQANHAKVLDLFRAWDQDGDGTVRKAELRRAIALLGYDAPDLEVDKLFDSFDRDGGGAIEYKELHRAIRRPSEVEERNRSLASSAPSTPFQLRHIQPRKDADAPSGVPPPMQIADSSMAEEEDLTEEIDEEAAEDLAAALYEEMADEPLAAPAAAPAEAPAAARPPSGGTLPPAGSVPTAPASSEVSGKPAGKSKANGKAAARGGGSGGLGALKPVDPIAARDGALVELLSLVETAAPWAEREAHEATRGLPVPIIAHSQPASASAAGRAFATPPTGSALADVTSALAIAAGVGSIGMQLHWLFMGALASPAAVRPASVRSLWPLHLMMAVGALWLFLVLLAQLGRRLLVTCGACGAPDRSAKAPLLPLTAAAGTASSTTAEASGRRSSLASLGAARLVDWSALAIAECFLASYLASWGWQPSGTDAGSTPPPDEAGGGAWVGPFGSAPREDADEAPLPPMYTFALSVATVCALLLLSSAALRGLLMAWWRLCRGNGASEPVTAAAPTKVSPAAAPVKPETKPPVAKGGAKDGTSIGSACAAGCKRVRACLDRLKAIAQSKGGSKKGAQAGKTSTASKTPSKTPGKKPAARPGTAKKGPMSSKKAMV